jgi:predicted 3-demethylubiquinone-9 3-methyltransferase (glyoxalase superfamily)
MTGGKGGKVMSAMMKMKKVDIQALKDAAAG